MDYPASQWAARHPVLVALLSAAAMFGLTHILYYTLWADIVSAAVMFVAVFLLWMPGGPARRRTERLCGPPNSAERPPQI